jgi:uncharacterized membrane protein
MIESIVETLRGLPKPLIVLFISCLPIAELRGAIPVALALGMSPFKAFWLGVIGNLIPVIPLLIFLGPISEWLRRFKIFEGFFDWLFKRTRKRGEKVERYGALGLIFFVAIPLPITGAWTGCAAAFVFGIRFIYAFPAILLGVLIAGVVVMLASLGVINLWFV